MKLFTVVFVSLSQDPECNGAIDVKSFFSEEEAKKCFAKWKEEEIRYQKEENGNEFVIEQDDEDIFHMSWCGGNEALKISLHEQNIKDIYLLEKLTEFLHGNRAIAELFVNNVAHYVDDAIQSGELQQEEIYDFFWDIVAENDTKDDSVHQLVDILKAMNGQHGQRRDSYGFLAELMEEYYECQINLPSDTI